MSGYTVMASQSGKYEAFFRLAAGDLDEAELAGWFRESAKPLTP
ncbi:MAG: hypothetical protein PW790_00660 [Parvibaculaceae bacterium]|nr:hypothetical protein [Parvibaculaceae bacterium]